MAGQEKDVYESFTIIEEMKGKYQEPNFDVDTEDTDELNENPLEVLKEAAFEILKENPGSDFGDWQQEFVSEYGNELVEEYGDNPQDVYSALSDLWESPYYDDASELEYNYNEWALAFATEEALQMYHDMIYQREKSVNEAVRRATQNIEKEEVQKQRYYRVKGKQLSLSLATHSGTLTKNDLENNLMAAIQKSNDYGEDWIQDLRLHWYQESGMVPRTDDESLLENEEEIERQIDNMLDPWTSGWRTEMLLDYAGVGEELVSLSEEELEELNSDESESWTLSVIITEHLPYEPPKY